VAPRAAAASASFNTIQNKMASYAEPLQKATAKEMGVDFGDNGVVDVTRITSMVRGVGEGLVTEMMEMTKGGKSFTDVLDIMKTKGLDYVKGLGEAIQRIPNTAKEISSKNGDNFQYTKLTEAINALSRQINPNFIQSAVNTLPVVNNSNVLSSTNLNSNTTNVNNSNVNNSSSVSVNGVIEHKFPDNLQNIWNMALNDPNWMSTLQKKLSEINSSNNALMGVGQ
jgi:hypothetical protein